MIEQMGYIGIAAEIANISMYLGMLFNTEFPRGFYIGSEIYNFVYSLYIAIIILFKNNISRILAATILILGLLKDMLWSQNPVICIIDSTICLVLLILINKHEEKEKIKTQKESN